MEQKWNDLNVLIALKKKTQKNQKKPPKKPPQHSPYRLNFFLSSEHRHVYFWKHCFLSIKAAIVFLKYVKDRMCKDLVCH